MVHAVTDDRVLALPDFLERAAALVGAPDVAIHLRGRLAARRMLALADRLRPLTADAAALLLIHDRADLALLCGADGVHLPGSGLETARVRGLLGDRALVGRSVHTPDEGRLAVEGGSDYVFLGNIWETPSHPGRPGLGPAAIARARPARVIAIGGVTAATAADAARAGAAGVAAIRGLWDAEDPAAAARAMRVTFGG